MSALVNAFIFTSNPSMIVSDAGTGAVNGTYTYTGQANGKAYYNKSGTAQLENSIVWQSFNNTWYIYGAVNAEYSSTGSDDVATPNLVPTWVLEAGANPVPTVTSA